MVLLHSKICKFNSLNFVINFIFHVSSNQVFLSFDTHKQIMFRSFHQTFSVGKIVWTTKGPRQWIKSKLLLFVFVLPVDTEKKNMGNSSEIIWNSDDNNMNRETCLKRFFKEKDCIDVEIGIQKSSAWKKNPLKRYFRWFYVAYC